METKVYLVECYVGSTLTDEETDNFVSAIYKTKEGATKYVEKQIKEWRINKKTPEEIETKSKDYKEIGAEYKITYKTEYIQYWITKVTVEE